jgi:glycine/D-amino acid oxidase-like deaminating enzyme
MSTSSKKVVVIGGGIVGSSTAFYLKKRGADVTLLEASYVAAGSSGKAGGFLVVAAAKTSLFTQSDVSCRLQTGTALLQLLCPSCPIVCIKSFPKNLAMLSDTESLRRLP